MSSCFRHSCKVKLRVWSPSVTTVAHSSPFRKAMTATSGLVACLEFCVIVYCILWLSPAKIAIFSESPKLFATFLHISPLFTNRRRRGAAAHGPGTATATMSATTHAATQGYRPSGAAWYPGPRVYTQVLTCCAQRARSARGVCSECVSRARCVPQARTHRALFCFCIIIIMVCCALCRSLCR